MSFSDLNQRLNGNGANPGWPLHGEPRTHDILDGIVGVNRFRVVGSSDRPLGGVVLPLRGCDLGWSRQRWPAPCPFGDCRKRQSSQSLKTIAFVGFGPPEHAA